MKYKLLTVLCFLAIWSCEDPTYSQGKRIYAAKCANCHMDNGKGLESLIPPLADSDYLRENQDILPCIINNGISTPMIVNGIRYEQPMPPASLSAVELNNVINYINTAWNNKIPEVSIKDTQRAIDSCK